MEHIRTNINDYIDTRISRFEFYPGLYGEEARWNSGNPLGTVFSIQLTPFLPGTFDIDEDDSVITTGFSNSHWIFSTLYTSADGYHPVSGNRLFGFTNNGDGTYTFFTRGVDRLSTKMDDWGNTLLNDFAFNSADNLWTSFQEKITADFTSNSNVSLDSTTYRPDYDKVAGILDGSEDTSRLGCK